MLAFGRKRSATIPLTLLEGAASFADRDPIGEINDRAADVHALPSGHDPEDANVPKTEFAAEKPLQQPP